MRKLAASAASTGKVHDLENIGDGAAEKGRREAASPFLTGISHVWNWPKPTVRRNAPIRPELNAKSGLDLWFHSPERLKPTSSYVAPPKRVRGARPVGLGISLHWASLFFIPAKQAERW